MTAPRTPVEPLVSGGEVAPIDPHVPDDALRSLEDICADVEFRPDGSTLLPVLAARDGAGMLRVAVRVPTSTGPVFLSPGPFRGDPMDTESVVPHVAHVCAWASAYLALANTTYRGEVIHTPDDHLGPVLVTPGVVLDDEAWADASARMVTLRDLAGADRFTMADETLGELGVTVPVPGSNRQVDALQSVLDRVQLQPAGSPHQALLLGAVSDDDGLPRLVATQSVHDTRGDGLKYLSQCLPLTGVNVCDEAAVLMYLARFVAWVGAHEAVEHLFFDGNLVYDPHQSGETAQPVVYLPGRVRVGGVLKTTAVTDPSPASNRAERRRADRQSRRPTKEHSYVQF